MAHPRQMLRTSNCSLLLIYLPRKDELAWVAGYVMRQFTCPQTVAHPSTNRARCRATALIETNTLPLHQTACIKFTHRPKIRFFPGFFPTRCTDSRQTWQGRRAREFAWLRKISPQSPQGVGIRPQNIKNFDRFLKFDV